MVRPIHIALLLVAMAVAGAADAAPRRIVSLNLCADQLLIALADRDQIAALTQFARDPTLSHEAARAKSYPVSKGSAEEVLALRPDLIIAAPHWRKDTLALLHRRGVKMIDIDDANSLEAIYRNIRTIAEVVGHPARGESLIRRMQADLDRLSRDAPGRGRVAAYYQRRGYLTGAGTLWDGIMARAGLVNLATTLHRPPLSHLAVEEMIAAHPDFLVMDSATRTVSDRGTEMLHHRALERIVPESHRLYMPRSLTVCGGPSYPLAVAALDMQIRKAGRVFTR